jgi:hypothetical protein
MLFKMVNKTKINSIINGNCTPHTMIKLRKKELLLLIKMFDEWESNNRDLSYKSRKLISNRYKDVLIFNSETIDKLNTFEDINSRNQIVFHGGCLGCHSQSDNGIKNCNGCQYFKAEWDKPDLSKNNGRGRQIKNVTNTTDNDNIIPFDNIESTGKNMVLINQLMLNKQPVLENKGNKLHLVSNSCFLKKL